MDSRQNGADTRARLVRAINLLGSKQSSFRHRRIQMSIILGINAYHASASAAVIVDGRVAAAIAEERLNRVKYFGAFPRLAVTECLRIVGADISDVEYVALG